MKSWSLMTILVVTILTALGGCAPYHSVDENLCPCAEGFKCCPNGYFCIPADQECPCRNPGPESCDGLDNDCDGQTDEDCCQDLAGWYLVSWQCPPGEADEAMLSIEQSYCDLSFELQDSTCQGTVDPQGTLTLECPGLQTGPCTGQLPDFEQVREISLSCESECDLGIRIGDCTYADEYTSCNDYDFCTIADVCTVVGCVGMRRDCADQNPCTIDSCDSGEQKCVHELKESCKPCTSASECDDGNVCTTDLCYGGHCDNPPVSDMLDCDDEDGCTYNDRCSTDTGVCRGEPLDCDDQDPCTVDSCYPESWSCGHAPADCSTPDAPGQGADLDQDGWGACCDCDDQDAEVHPGALELCDSIDNDCDGITDSDIMDVSGRYLVEVECLSIETTTEVDVTQSGCQFDFQAMGFDCQGSFVGTNMEVDCDGIPITCTAKLPVGANIHITCMPDCWFDLTLLDPECQAADCTWPGLPSQGEDADDDTWGYCCDCDDSQVTVFPGANELCDNLDNDCDGQTDEDQTCLEGCERNADCPEDLCCSLFANETHDGFLAMCYDWGYPTEPDIGEPCQEHHTCCGGLCNSYPGFCPGLCLTDGDCPFFQQDPCTNDNDCESGYLCLDSVCERRFSCKTLAFGFRPVEEVVWAFDTECMPERRSCGVDADCRPGEACRYFRDVDEPDASYQCDLAYPYPGELGDECDVWEQRCRTGMCRMSEVLGHYICTQACLTDADCGEAGYYCDIWEQDIGGAAIITRRECFPGIK